MALRGADAGLGRILARTIAARGGVASDRRRERRQASRALDELIGAPVVDRGRVYFPGEYHPVAAQVVAQRAEHSNHFRRNAFRFALEVLAAVLGSASDAEIRSIVLRGSVLCASAPRHQEVD
ncbi:hypothetical protein C5E51_29790 [Nocardia nova]|nr:hypothetical protein C5E51_29790 [Nocardia nova]